MIQWVVAGLLGMATGLRIGWVLFHKRSAVSMGMIVALGSLAVVASLSWEPLAVLVDEALGWPNLSFALSQVGMVGSAVGSCVMITSMSASRTSLQNNHFARIQYAIAGGVSALALGIFFARGELPARYPDDFINEFGQQRGIIESWLLPTVYTVFVMLVVIWSGFRYITRTQRGRGLVLFTVGISLIVVTSLLYVFGGLFKSGPRDPALGVAGIFTIAAFAAVAAGSLLPTFENWLVARKELHVLKPLWREMKSRHPDLAIGTRKHGPAAFQVADRMAYISDALFTEAKSREMLYEALAEAGASEVVTAASDDIAKDRVEESNKYFALEPVGRARLIAQWVASEATFRKAGPQHARKLPKASGGQAETEKNLGSVDAIASGFPSSEWLHQPEDYSDREWILCIASEYRRELN
ncbi:MAG: hypothetical protein ACRCSF_03780 [Mycobacteriaceae bacterium]